MFTETELKTNTAEEINAMPDEVEAIPYADMDHEFYTPEEAYELVMSDIKPLYGITDTV